MEAQNRDPSLDEILQPFVARFWVIALIAGTAVALAVALSLSKPQVYLSQAVIAVDPAYLQPGAAASIVNARSTGGVTIKAEVAAGGLLEVKASGSERDSLASVLTAAIEDARIRVVGLLPSSITQQQAATAQVHELRELLAQSPTDPGLTMGNFDPGGLVSRIAALMERADMLSQREDGRQGAYKVVTEATWPEPTGERVPLNNVGVTGFLGVLIGIVAVYLIHARELATQRKEG